MILLLRIASVYPDCYALPTHKREGGGIIKMITIHGGLGFHSLFSCENGRIGSIGMDLLKWVEIAFHLSALLHDVVSPKAIV